jgi:protoporphyrinogen oxidase
MDSQGTFTQQGDQALKKVTILGAGVSGLSASYHIGHDKCVLYEAGDHYGGHCHSIVRDGFTWDDGPHVNFGSYENVADLFRNGNEVLEFIPVMSNYFRGHFIDHPAQSNLYQVPEPLRTKCLESFLATRAPEGSQPQPKNYREWLHQAFGPVFADTFPAAYTRKYWTTDPINLGPDWVAFPSARLPRRTTGNRPTRVYNPSVEDVTQGSKGPLGRSTHYVKDFRYPSQGGFVAFFKKLAQGAHIEYRKSLTWINFRKREMGFSDGSRATYEKLVSTIPLPVLIKCSQDAPADVHEANSVLRCTNFLLVEVGANHPTKRQEHWMYVYDEDKYSVRISVTERFSPNNAPAGHTGLSVEVYGSPYRPLPTDHQAVAKKVQEELVEMGLIESLESVVSSHVRFVPWANVIFDHDRQGALDRVMGFLGDHGVSCLGRYAEWEYLMTHDCVVASKQIAQKLLKEIA